jgi:hypothetical protein
VLTKFVWGLNNCVDVWPKFSGNFVIAGVNVGLGVAVREKGGSLLVHSADIHGKLNCRDVKELRVADTVAQVCLLPVLLCWSRALLWAAGTLREVCTRVRR